MKEVALKSKFRFLIINGLKGLFWMAILLIAYLFFKDVVETKYPDSMIEHFYSRPLIIYAIYFGSEFFFGILPPELFMIWAINKADTVYYIYNVAFFAVVSYALGYLNFLIGQYLHKRISFRYFRIKFLKKSWPQVGKYGIFLIIVAALTPLPWAAISLLVGSANYPSKKYLLYGLTRILRFAMYGFLIYQTHNI